MKLGMLLYVVPVSLVHLVLCFLFSNEQSGEMTFATPFGTSKFCNVRKQKEANVLQVVLKIPGVEQEYSSGGVHAKWSGTVVYSWSRW